MERIFCFFAALILRAFMVYLKKNFIRLVLKLKFFEETIDSEEIYNGKILRLIKDKVLLENGKTALREVIRHCGAAAVLPFDGEGNAYFVEQFRYPVGQKLFEVPAGKIDLGETPLECAKRELAEECGLFAEEWVELGPVFTSPGFCDEAIWLFSAKKLSETTASPDEDEFLNVVKIPFSEAVKMVRSGKIPDLKTQALVLRAENL